MQSNSEIADRPVVRLFCSALSSLTVHVGALCLFLLVTWTQSEWAEPEPVRFDVSLQMVDDGDDPTFRFSAPIEPLLRQPERFNHPDSESTEVAVLSRPERTEPCRGGMHCLFPCFDSRCRIGQSNWNTAGRSQELQEPLGAVGNVSRAGHGRGAGVGDFFGEKGLPQANSIVFVVDRSGSMDSISEAVKVELAKAIDKLGPAQQFNILWFADGEPLAFAVAPVPATDENKRAAFQHLSQVDFRGPVDASGALFLALDLKPELIYVLTDGNFEIDFVDALTRRNAGRTRINVIGIVIGGGEGLGNLQRLAQENRGTFKEIQAVKLAGS